MSITDELREYVNQTPVPKSRALMEARDRFNAIADRIDAEHDAKVAYWQSASYKDGYDEGFASADDWLAQHEDAMAEHGWVRLPKDANGAYIHVGDVVIESLPFGGESKPLVVDRMELGRYDGKDAWAVALDTDKSPWAQPPLLHHHREPTVEDVLRELEGMRGNGATYEDVMARCDELAKTLRGLLAVRTNERRA